MNDQFGIRLQAVALAASCVGHMLIEGLLDLTDDSRWLHSAVADAVVCLQLHRLAAVAAGNCVCFGEAFAAV
jgi:hypothetical protein